MTVSALTKLQEVNQAIAASDFEAATLAVEQLQPMLVNNEVEDLLKLREYLAGLTLEVTQIKAGLGDELRSLNTRKVAVNRYQQVDRLQGRNS